MKAESKAIIFGRYYYTQKMVVDLDTGKRDCLDNANSMENYAIELKPLSSISVEDAKLLKIHPILIEHLRMGYNEYEPSDYVASVLRQLGYATSQTVIEYGKAVTYTVEQLVNEGLFKLN